MSLVLSISFFIVFLLFGIRGVINLFISLAIYSCAAYYLCDINPEETYSWYSGIISGLPRVPANAKNPIQIQKAIRYFINNPYDKEK